MPFVEVQNRIYNAMTEGLGLSRDSFQIIMSAPPLIPGNDRMLWDFLDNIPPLSLDRKFTPSGGNQFSSNYKATISALTANAHVDLARDIGQQNYDRFLAYMDQSHPTAPTNRYADFFFSWALLHAPSVADVGAADYSTLLLDPVASAGLALDAYEPARGENPRPGLPYDWTKSAADLFTMLRQAPSARFRVSSRDTSSDVANTWSHGGHSALFGLLGSGDADSHISQHFSDSAFDIQASFGHVLRFQANPGQWYNSGALGLAFSNQGSPPWKPGGTQWANVFGPTGILPRVTVNLLVVDTMNITVTAKTSYNGADKTAIEHGSAGGFPPFYSASNGNGVTSDAKVDNAGATVITTRSVPGVPVVIGCDVLPMSRFLGHAVAARQRLAEAAAG